MSISFQRIGARCPDHRPLPEGSGMTARRLDELLFWMSSIAGKAPEQWERTFARSILRQAKRPSWKPSAKQRRLMHRLVDEYLAAGENVQLIEED